MTGERPCPSLECKLGVLNTLVRAGRPIASLATPYLQPIHGRPRFALHSCLSSQPRSSTAQACLKQQLARKTGSTRTVQLRAFWSTGPDTGFARVCMRAESSRIVLASRPPASVPANASPVKSARPARRPSSGKATIQEEVTTATRPVTSASASKKERLSREQAKALLAECLPELAAGTADLKGPDAASALDFLHSANLTGALSRLESSQHSVADSAQPTSDPPPQLSSAAQAVLAELRLPEGAVDNSLDPNMPPKNPPKPRGRPPAKGSAAAKRRAKTEASGLSENAAAEIAERLAHADPALLDSMIDAASQATAQPTADPAPGLEALGGNVSTKLEAPTEEPTAHPDRANSTLASNDAALIAGGARDALPSGKMGEGPALTRLLTVCQQLFPGEDMLGVSDQSQASFTEQS